MITVVDYGAGNAGSVIRMVERAGGEAIRATTADDIRTATKLILPGVGSFDYGMSKLAEHELIGPLNEAALGSKTPILGICLGMQLMCKSSEEGKLPGLGWLDASVTHFSKHDSGKLKIPHMGWNVVRVSKENPLIESTATESRFYFVHSYRVSCQNSEDVLAVASYGSEFVAGFSRGNIFGVQFHPEKSHQFGLNLIRHFVELDRA